MSDPNWGEQARRDARKPKFAPNAGEDERWNAINMCTEDGLRFAAEDGELTAREINRLFEQGRLQKIDYPALDDKDSPLDLGYIPVDLSIPKIPPRPLILGYRLQRRNVSLLAGPPGCGKTALNIATAISVATGKSFTGEPVHEQGKVWFYANEEDKDELWRRFGAFCIHHHLDPLSFRDRLFLSSGYGKSLVIADRHPVNRSVMKTSNAQALIDSIKVRGIDVLIIDPMASIHRVSENANEEQEQVMDILRHIAKEGNCAIDVSAHIPKTGDGPEGHAGNMNAVRGATSVPAAARHVFTVARMSKETGEKHGLEAHEWRSMVRLDMAKVNYSPPADSALWLRMASVCLDNSPTRPDWVGVFEPAQLAPLPEKPDSTEPIRAALRAAIISLDIAPGDSVTFPQVKDELSARVDLSYRRVRDLISRAIPQHDTAEGRKQGVVCTWSKGQNQTDPLRIHRLLP